MSVSGTSKGSTSNELFQFATAFGVAAKDAVEDAREKIAAAIGARAKEIVFTSGATESNNLAIRGVAERHAARGRHIISIATEHPAVLDPLAALARRGFELTLLPVIHAREITPPMGVVPALWWSEEFITWIVCWTI